MTKEDILEYFNDINDAYNNPNKHDDLSKMLDMLAPQEPFGKDINVPATDAISRQAALASIKNLYPDMPIVDIFGARRKWLEKYAPYFECENAIEQLPPVTPQTKTKTGHWYVNEWGNITCSECGCAALYDKVYPNKSMFGEAIRVKTTFCPTCGTKMEESEDKE